MIALLSFGYRMAIYVYQKGLPGFLCCIARYIADFMLQNRIAQWIAQQGGWVSRRERGVAPGDAGRGEAAVPQPVEGVLLRRGGLPGAAGRSNTLWSLSVSC